MASWDLFINGADYSVSVERMPNGKDAIRVNGRIAAKPMEPGDAESALSVGGKPYIIRRRGADEFDVIEDKSGMAAERSRSTARAVLAHAGEAPLPMVRKSALKTPAIGWGVAVVMVGILVVYAMGPGYAKLAASRVDQILHDMMSGRDTEMQFSVTRWAKNKRVLDASEMSWASDHFDKWRHEKDLYGKPFSRYAIVKSELLKEEKTPTAIVTFTIEEKEYKVRVPKDLPISWEN